MVVHGEVWVSRQDEVGDGVGCKGDSLGACAGNTVLLAGVQSERARWPIAVGCLR